MVPVGSWEGKNGVTNDRPRFKIACLYQGFSVSKAPLKTLFARYCTCVILRFGESAVHGGMTNKIPSSLRTPSTSLSPISLYTCNSFWILRPTRPLRNMLASWNIKSQGAQLEKPCVSNSLGNVWLPGFCRNGCFSRKISSRSASIFLCLCI